MISSRYKGWICSMALPFSTSNPMCPSSMRFRSLGRDGSMNPKPDGKGQTLDSRAEEMVAGFFHREPTKYAGTCPSNTAKRKDSSCCRERYAPWFFVVLLAFGSFLPQEPSKGETSRHVFPTLPCLSALPRLGSPAASTPENTLEGLAIARSQDGPWDVRRIDTAGLDCEKAPEGSGLPRGRPAPARKKLQHAHFRWCGLAMKAGSRTTTGFREFYPSGFRTVDAQKEPLSTTRCAMSPVHSRRGCQEQATCRGYGSCLRFGSGNAELDSDDLR